MRLGQKSFKKKVHFSGDLNPPTFPFEITRPLIVMGFWNEFQPEINLIGSQLAPVQCQFDLKSIIIYVKFRIQYVGGTMFWTWFAEVEACLLQHYFFFFSVLNCNPFFVVAAFRIIHVFKFHNCNRMRSDNTKYIIVDSYSNESVL